MRKILGRYLIPVLAAGMLVFAVIHVVKAQQVPPRPPPPVEPARTPFGKTVAGAGLVEARTQNISLGAPLPGIVLEVYGPTKPGMAPWDALVGETVKQGDPLFLVDNRQLLAQLAYAKANYDAADAQLRKLQNQPRKEEVTPAEAAVAVAKAQKALQQDLADRDRRLMPSGSASEEEYRQRVLTAEVAKQQELQAQKQLDLINAGAWVYDIDIAKANKAVAEAQVGQIETDLKRVLVRAPVDGVVLQVNVRPGEYVGAPPGQALMVLGAIDKTVNVRVDIDEHDIPRFKKGAPARASLRGTPEVMYPLTFVRVEPYVIPKKSLTGDNTERVDTRVLQVIYSLDAADKPVYVGQQMDVFIDAAGPDAAESAGSTGG
jgi:multidrug efflux pump subunit AcrA (membrane-fusion protein)